MGKVALYDVMSLESVVVQIFFTKVPLTVSSCQSLFLKMNVKFDFRNLNYLQFVTKHIQFGKCCSNDLQTAVFCVLIFMFEAFEVVRLFTRRAARPVYIIMSHFGDFGRRPLSNFSVS